MNIRKTFSLTKIIATLGPATSDPETLTSLIENGARVFRVNFSHGNFEEYREMIRNVRETSKMLGVYTALLGDLSGPKIRVGEIPGNGIFLKPGMRVRFCDEESLHASSGTDAVICFTTSYPPFTREVKPGQRVLLDDGNLLLHCESSSGTDVICRVVNGGLVTTHKGINLPDTELSIPALTQKDYRCIDFAVEQGFDFLALSFVRQGEDVKLLKQRLTELKARPGVSWPGPSANPIIPPTAKDFEGFIPVISKIEKPQAIDHLISILEESDGIMVARGDLGVEMDLAEVAVHQKNIIRLCRQYGKPVIVATQMLQSMIESPVPTRAEVSDVANAIFDGADAVMLSGETAVGKYPVDTVKMMNRIARKANDYIRSLDSHPLIPFKPIEEHNRSAAIAHGVITMVRDVDARLIIVWSQFGGATLFLSQHKLPVPIVSFSNNERTLRQHSLLYGVHPVYMEMPSSGSRFIENVDHLILKNAWARKGEPIVIALGEPIHRVGITNRVVVHYVGESEL